MALLGEEVMKCVTDAPGKQTTMRVSSRVHVETVVCWLQTAHRESTGTPSFSTQPTQVPGLYCT